MMQWHCKSAVTFHAVRPDFWFFLLAGATTTNNARNSHVSRSMSGISRWCPRKLANDRVKHMTSKPLLTWWAVTQDASSIDTGGLPTKSLHYEWKYGWYILVHTMLLVLFLACANLENPKHVWTNTYKRLHQNWTNYGVLKNFRNWPLRLMDFMVFYVWVMDFVFWSTYMYVSLQPY